MNILHYDRLTILSHFLVGFIGASVSLAVPSLGSYFGFLVAVGLAAIAAFFASRFCATQLGQGFALVEQAVITSEKPVGDTVFHAMSDKLVNHVARLAAAAAKGREQSREVRNVLQALDRRGPKGDEGSPARQLSLLVRSIGSSALSAMDEISMVGSNLQGLRAKMIGSANDEFELVKIAASEIRNVAEDVASISESAKRAKASDISAAGKSEALSRQLLNLQGQLDQVREQINAQDKKSQALKDQMSEVTSFVQSIHEYSTKADTMALNASIESVRAGEHGLAFSAAADEIRRMTSIISDSTVSALDQIKLIEDAVSDVSAMGSLGQSVVDRQVTSIRDLTQGVSEIRQSTTESRHHLDRLLESTEAELRNLNVIANALGGVFESSERTGAQVEEEQKIRGELNVKLFELSVLLSPLTDAASEVRSTGQTNVAETCEASS